MGYKCCFVPMCKSTTIKTPDKLFFLIPRGEEIRKKWFKAIRRADLISNTSQMFCCEDHFDIETDMENYLKHKLVGGRLTLKKGVLPHKFSCQEPYNNENTMFYRKNNTWVDKETGQLLKWQHKTGVSEPQPTVNKTIGSKKKQQEIYTNQNKEDQASNKPTEAKETIDDMDENMLKCSSDNLGERDNEEFLCNVCEKNIVSFRYTCVQCAEFDMCSACEALQAHAAHYVLRVPAHRPLLETRELVRRVREEVERTLFPEPEVIKIEIEIEPEPDPLLEEMWSRPHESNILEQSMMMMEPMEVKEEPREPELGRDGDAPPTADHEEAPTEQPPDIKSQKRKKSPLSGKITNKKSPSLPPIWQYFEKSPYVSSRAICKLCNRPITMGHEAPRIIRQRGMKDHLRCWHKEKYRQILRLESELKNIKKQEQIVNADFQN